MTLRLLLRLCAEASIERVEPLLSMLGDQSGGLLWSWLGQRHRALAELSRLVVDIVRNEPSAERARTLVQHRWDRPWLLRALASVLREACEDDDARSFVVGRGAVALATSLGPASLLTIVASAGRFMDEASLGRLFWRGPSTTMRTACELPVPRHLFDDAIKLKNRKLAAELLGLVALEHDSALLDSSRLLLRECFAARLKELDDDNDLLAQAWAFARRIENALDVQRIPPRSIAAAEPRTTDELAATFALNVIIKRPTPSALQIVADSLIAVEWKPPASNNVKYVATSIDTLLNTLVPALPDLFRLDRPSQLDLRRATVLLTVATAFKLDEWRAALWLALERLNYHQNIEERFVPSQTLASTIAVGLNRCEPCVHPLLLQTAQQLARLPPDGTLGIQRHSTNEQGDFLPASAAQSFQVTSNGTPPHLKPGAFVV